MHLKLKKIKHLNELLELLRLFILFVKCMDCISEREAESEKNKWDICVKMANAVSRQNK